MGGEGSAVIFGVDNMTTMTIMTIMTTMTTMTTVNSVTRKMLEHDHRGARVLLPLPPDLVEVVGVAGGGAVAGACLTGGGATDHSWLGHDGVERVDLHVDMTAVALHHLLVPGEPHPAPAQLQLPGSGPDLGPGDAAVQGAAELWESLAVMNCQGCSAENLQTQHSQSQSSPVQTRSVVSSQSCQNIREKRAIYF